MFPNIDLDNPRTIVKAYAERSFEYHMLTPIVMKAAEDGDPVCLEIIQRASYHLMELLEALLKSYDAAELPVALMGGIIENDTLLAKMLYERIDNHKILNRVEPQATALEGGMLIGYQLIEQSDEE